MQKPVQQTMQSLAHGLASGSFIVLVCSSFQPKDFRAIGSQTKYPLCMERPGSPPFLRTPNGIQGDISEILQFSSVAQSYPTLHNLMDHSTPGLPVHHQLPESTQTHLHWVGGAIQPSHPLLSTSPPAPNLSQHQGLFKWISSSHQVAKVLELQLQHQSFQWTLRTDLL